MHSPEEAYLYLQRLRSILRYSGVCRGNLEEGSLRCDANVSIRLAGSEDLGRRTELKNLNSFRNVQRALQYEIDRQIRTVSSGGKVKQETVLWDAAGGVTRPMRGKEEAHDYRYFPEPDLPPLVIPDSWIEEIRTSLPVLPAARKQRLLTTFRLNEKDAHLLSLERELADYYEEVAEASGNPKAAANFIINDLLREQKKTRLEAGDIPLPGRHLAELIRMVDDGVISLSVARQEVFGEMYRSGRSARELVEAKGNQQISDPETIKALVGEVLEAHPEQLERYREGRTRLFAYFVGQVMKRSGGKANPGMVNTILEEILKT
jgi:aspartyl-tRNA(Asn)/glutamyl-tRNA(Gln) amidotransferase subunit B